MGIVANNELETRGGVILEIAFVEGTIMIHGDFGVVTEEVGEAVEDGGFWERGGRSIAAPLFDEIFKG